MIKTCEICGKMFETDNKKKKFCSGECQKENLKRFHREYRRSQREMEREHYTKQCLYCGQTFYTTRSSTKYCCDKCREDNRKIRRRKNYKSNVYERFVEKSNTRKGRENASLTATENEARAKGLSYGQLQMQRYMERNPDIARVKI